MATNFPTSIDSFTNPTSGDTLDSPSHSAQHTNINDAMVAVQTRLGAQSGTIGTWTAFTPTFTAGLTVGNGTVTGYYTTINKITFVTIGVEFGSTTAITADVRVQVPVGASTLFDLAAFAQGNAYDDSTAGYFKLMGRAYGPAEFRLRCMGTSGSAVSALALSATVPFTWDTGDRLNFGSYYRIS